MLFIGASFLGVILRMAYVWGLPEWLDFRKIRHAHSHVALLGWLYLGIYILIIKRFKLYHAKYQKLYWLTFISVIGMFIAFPIQGYGPVSITFSSIHILLSYIFIYFVFRDIKNSDIKPHVVLFTKTSLIFLFLSSLGAWSLAPILKLGFGKGALYYGAIQFFLHFQFNGWLVFSILALFFSWISTKDIEIDNKLIRKFYLTLTISCVLTYALAVTWSTPDQYIFLINSVGVIIQAISLVYLFKILVSLNRKIKKSLPNWIYNILFLSFLSLSIKIIIQSAVAIPFIATISYTVRNFVIGFIHLLMLGSISLFIIAFFEMWFERYKMHFGLKIFIVGLVISELLLFLQGFMLWATLGFIPFYNEILLFFSALMPLGILYYTNSIEKSSPIKV